MKAYLESFWADLFTSFPLLAAELGDCDLSHRTACVLGCSDGKFVIPLAVQGCKVVCVDVDPVMLGGGIVRYRGQEVAVRGLRANLKAADVTAQCELVEADFMTWKTTCTFDLVLTSGSWAYNRNLPYGLGGVIGVMQRLVAPGGYLFADYLLPVTDFEHGLDLYPHPEDLAPYFPEPAWRVVHNRDVGMIGESHYGQEEWHYHNYGALLVRRAR